MMRRDINRLTALLLGLALCLGWAGAAQAQLTDEQAERLMKLSGQWEQPGARWPTTPA